MATLLFLLILTVVIAALGRSAIPGDERLPLPRWTLRDLAANVVRGGRVLGQRHQRQCRLWDGYLDDLQPWHRRSDDHAVGKQGSARC